MGWPGQTALAAACSLMRPPVRPAWGHGCEPRWSGGYRLASGPGPRPGRARARRPLRLRQCLLACSSPLFQAGLYEWVKVVIPHFLRVGFFDVGTQVFYAAFIQHLGKTLLAPDPNGLGGKGN